MHNRRARPTLRLLREDLISDWDSPQPQRLLAEGRHDDLHPLSELPHPIVAKARESFGNDVKDDNFVGPIASASVLPLLEIKQSQWRGGVWEDESSGVRWLIVAGLAKGGHQDRDDFYKRIERENDDGDPSRWLPTTDDLTLLKRETAARIRTEWELAVQRDLLEGLRSVQHGGCWRIDVQHPLTSQGRLARVEVTVTRVRDDDYEADEVVVGVVPETKFAGSDLLWQLTVRVLISIEPPEQGWDRYGDSYSNMGEIGAWAARVKTLEEIVSANDLAVSQPGLTSHYTHQEHLAGSTINGDGVRGLCGVYFVPTRDHESLPVCPQCQEVYEGLPKVEA